MPDMIIPFIMLLIITIALILERKFQEDKIVAIYKEKLENWKRNTQEDNNTQNCKELVGLVFLEDEKINIQVLDSKVQDRLERKKYTLV